MPLDFIILFVRLRKPVEFGLETTHIAVMALTIVDLLAVVAFPAAEAHSGLKIFEAMLRVAAIGVEQCHHSGGKIGYRLATSISIDEATSASYDKFKLVNILWVFSMHEVFH